MHNQFKKAMATILAVIMLLSMLPTSVFAENIVELEAVVEVTSEQPTTLPSIEDIPDTKEDTSAENPIKTEETAEVSGEEQPVVEDVEIADDTAEGEIVEETPAESEDIAEDSGEEQPVVEDAEIADDIIVRITDPNGRHHEVQAFVSCFDREAPLLTAGIVDQSLQAVALDSLSGVAGIGVNELLFTTFDSGLLDVRLESRLNRYKQLKVYAYDHAGNVSQEVVLDNPYYVASTSPTKKPSSGGSGNTTSKPTAVPTVVPTLVPTAVPTPVPEMTYTPGTAFQMDGNMQTLDLLFSSNTNKQFISVQTRNGETYYLVIDYDKPIDEKGNLYETYFLNLVDDRDLMDVVSEEDYVTPKPEIVYVTPEPTKVPVVVAPVDDDTEENGASGILALFMLAGIGGGALWYFKFRKGDRKKQTENAFDEYDFDDEEESEEE